MEDIQYFEVECAVFRRKPGADLELFIQDTGKWSPYTGDASRVYRLSNPMTLEEVRPYMDRDPVDEANQEAA